MNAKAEKVLGETEIREIDRFINSNCRFLSCEVFTRCPTGLIHNTLPWCYRDLEKRGDLIKSVAKDSPRIRGAIESLKTTAREDLTVSEAPCWTTVEEIMEQRHSLK